MTQLLSFYAGEKAYARIRESGLSSADVKVVAGAAGGPKWLILRHLDRMLFGSWLAEEAGPVHLVGSSIAAWRFAAACHKDPLAALDRFEKAYLEQSYPEDPPPETVSRELMRILSRLMAPDGAEQILAHPVLRLNFLAVRCRGALASDTKALLLPALAAAACANAMFRRAMGLFFERTLFYDARDRPPFYSMQGFPLQRVPLSSANLQPALMASGSIPLLMNGVRDVSGAASGTYRDGGILDYHMNIDFGQSGEGIVLFPHYAESLVPGWLDKHLPWRGADLKKMRQVVLIAPSRELLRRLPEQKIPDRQDFYRFAGRDDQRVRYWRKVLDMSRRAAEEFAQSVENGEIRERVRPLSELFHRR